MNDIRLQVMWNRLLSVVEEQAKTLVRTAFSTSAREAGDISAGVFAVDGRMLAQAVAAICRSPDSCWPWPWVCRPGSLCPW